MKPHPKLRKTIKWGGPLMVLLMLATIWFSGPYSGFGQWQDRSGWTIGLAEASFMLSYSVPKPGQDIGWISGRARGPYAGTTRWLPYFFSFGGGEWMLYVPLWLFVPPLLVVTAIAWRRDAAAYRSEHPCECPRCHYDRTGLAIGAVCPECGALPPSTVP